MQSMIPNTDSTTQRKVDYEPDTLYKNSKENLKTNQFHWSWSFPDMMTDYISICPSIHDSASTNLQSTSMQCRSRPDSDMECNGDNIISSIKKQHQMINSRTHSRYGKEKDLHKIPVLCMLLSFRNIGFLIWFQDRVFEDLPSFPPPAARIPHITDQRYFIPDDG